MNKTLAMLLISAGITFALRAVPFLLFGRGKIMPEAVSRLSRALPAAIMAVLVIYCLRGVMGQSFAASLPMLIATLATAGIHLWKRRTPLSIACGTVLYMALIRILA